MLKSLTWIAISTLFITPIVDNTQKGSEHICKCLLDDSSFVYIYDTINGSIIDSMQNDFENEEYFSVLITKFQGDWCKIGAYSISDSYDGWVKLKTFKLYTYSANYNSELTLYSHPAIKSKTVFNTEEYIRNEMEVLDCESGWLLLSFEHKGKTIIGWIREEDTCPNPYTNCN